MGDEWNIKSLAEQNVVVTENVKSMSKKLRTVDPKAYEATSKTAKQWTQNVHELKTNLEQQKGTAQNMRGNVLKEEEEQQQSDMRERFNYVLERLKTDIRFFFLQLQEFVDLPHDYSRERTWDHHAHLMETEMKKLPACAGDTVTLQNLDSLVSMLNFRDKVMCTLMKGMLYQKVVLDWDLKTNREYAEKVTCDLFDQVVNTVSKNLAVPAKLVTEVSTELGEQGPFSYRKRQGGVDELLQQPHMQQQLSDAAAAASPTTDLPEFPSALLATLREFRSVDHGLRNIKFGTEVLIPDFDSSTGRHVAAEELRAEVNRWFNKCQELEHELQVSKASRHAPLHQQVEVLNQKYQAERDRNSRLTREKGNLESEQTRLSNERHELVAKLKEANERYSRMASANVPKLDRLEELMSKSSEAVDVLTADAELLSAMFRTQVQENSRSLEERDGIAKDLKNLQRLLRHERQKNQFMKDELKKKETLILRAMAARQSMHDDYTSEKNRIRDANEKMAQNEAEKDDIKKEIKSRDLEIKRLKQEMMRFRNRTDELEQQKAYMFKKFKESTGQQAGVLLDQFKLVQTFGKSVHDDEPSEDEAEPRRPGSMGTSDGGGGGGRGELDDMRGSPPPLGEVGSL